MNMRRSVRPYDAVIVGSGQGGVPLARSLTSEGWKVAIVEAGHVGGSCVNVGCTPTKTMIASARTAYLARRAAEYGLRAVRVEARMEEIVERKQRVVESFRAGNVSGLEEAGVELVRGRARLVGPRQVEVALRNGGTRTLDTERIVLNTGASPRVPPLTGIESVRWFDSTSIMELSDLPKHLIVLGGGYIGVEFAQLFRRLGSEVTILERGPQLLGREDEDVARAVAEILEEDGIQVHCGVEVGGVEEGKGREVVVTLRGGRSPVTGSHLLLATGRVPNSEQLDLAAAGVETDEGGHIRVDDRLQTTAPGVWAIGDVKPGPAFTHVSYDDFRVLRENLIGDGGGTTTGRLIPYAVFLDPQLGRVGLSEREARERKLAYAVAKMPVTQAARAIETGETRGVWKVLVETDTERILGAAILSVEGGEVMSMLQIAMMGGLSYRTLRDGIFAHPTLAESLNTLFSQLE